MSVEQDPNALMHAVIQRVAVGPHRGRNITRQQAEQVMTAILNGEVSQVQIAVFMIALRMKGESMDELSGLFAAMQKSITKLIVPVAELVCLADPFDGYLRSVPVTPFVPAVLAACGLTTVIKGVKTVGPKHGVTAHKVYQLAGIEPMHRADQAALDLTNHGWAYLDQRQYSGKLYDLISLRESLVKRTAINTLERLLMPLQAQQNTHLVLGYVHQAYPDIYSKIAKQAGYNSALLIKGVEGGMSPALNKPMRRFFFDFTQGGDCMIEKEITALPEELVGEQAALSGEHTGHLAVERCLDIGLRVLAGEKGAARDSLVVTAAHILAAHDSAYNRADSFAAAVEKAQNCLDNGFARARFQCLIDQQHQQQQQQQQHKRELSV